MRKLSLRIEDLAVTTFLPAPASARRGTAHAHEDTLPDPGGSVEEPVDTQPDPCFTCEVSCPNGC
jgi:hypothetical protein